MLKNLSWIRKNSLRVPLKVVRVLALQMYPNYTVPGNTIWPPYFRRTYMRVSLPPGCGLGVRRTTSPHKETIVEDLLRGNVRRITGQSTWLWRKGFNPYPTAFPYGNGMVLHFYQQQESSTTKTVHKVIN